ncbi:flagellar motor switch protein FliN [Treponema sp. Marseille-Q4132]|uniref:flagellar motor switch protein FliN n=1 Tax=Treponema sp. Marseille-Q4132 TaxID=2766701 RepID=UPI0016530459|nr:flagellar motor switch protein FliN [Treponema sp. Marseille-Q4132]QNL97710.1 flagellar motor switch protein FliN [Treponema sp. Marseille-Q4132]
MSDGAISQDEIDALLSGVSVDGLNSSGTVGGMPSVQLDTAVLQKFADELKTPLAENLNKMTGANFSADTPVVEQLDRDRLLAKLPEVVVNILADFSSGLSGDHLYILAPEFAQKIVGLMNKEDNADIDDMALSVIAETVSTHTNDEIQALEKTGKISGISCNPPTARNDPKAMIRVPQNQFVLFNYPLSLDGQGYTLWEAVGATAAEQMIRALGSGNSVPEMSMGGTLSAADIASVGTMASPGINMGSMGQSMNMGQSMPMMGQMGSGIPNVQSLQYPMLQGNIAGSGEQGNIGLIMDVYMEMTVELGRTKKQIKDILGMGEGTIIELDKLAGEPVDILVNHKPIAKGEVVVIDENFGVRVTEILSSLERVTELR